MDNKQKIIQVTITSTIYKVLGDYLQDYRSPAYPSQLKNNQNQNTTNFDWQQYATDFLIYSLYDQNNEIISNNLDNILDAWKNYPSQIEKIQNLQNQLEYPLKPGIKFYIPVEKISKESLLTKGVEVISNNEPAFKAKALIDLESDLGYKKVFNQDYSNLSQGDLKYQYPDMTVWIWCRSLSSNNSKFSNDLTGSIFNITPFITNLTTSQTKNGANFSFSLAPISAEKSDDNGQWIIKKNTLINSDNGFISESFIHEDLEKLIRNQFFFHNAISSNDLVFIRFETLEKEAQQRLKDSADFIVDKSNLPNRIYDMIGLVDSNNIVSSFSSNDVQISISGRDLSKLFIEDGSYFYSMESKQGIFYLHGGATRENEFTQRIISDNAYLYFGLYYNNSVEDILKFVIQQLSNIRVVPDELFEGYGIQKKNTNNVNVSSNTENRPEEIRQEIERRNTKVNNSVFANDEAKKEMILQLEKRKESLVVKQFDIIQKIKVFRENQYKNEGFNEIRYNVSTDVYNSLKKFINYTLNNTTPNGITIAKINQNKYSGWRSFIYNEFSGINKNILDNIFPFDFVTSVQNSIFSLFNNSTDESIRYFNDSKEIESIIQDIYLLLKEENEIKKLDFVEYPESIGKGIWQIVKLVIDKKVAKRLLIDSSISSATGSLINYLKKVAQEPFVELFMDTYYDQFYIIVRQPPTDKIGITSYLSGNYQSQDNLNENDNEIKKPVIVDIEEIDIINDSLKFDESNIYSWYHFTPQAALIANATQFSTAYLPAIYFPEYAAIWGSKSLDFIHNYTNYYFQYSKENSSEDIPDNYRQMFYDMKYVVESNQYMPFCRKGSITINGGDRRMKIGNPIRLKSTGEIFWIDSISNSFSINGANIERQTTLQLSRGLKEAFIYGVKGSTLNNYFKNKGFNFSDDQVFSYFSIINTTLNFNKTKKVPKYKTVTEKVPIKEVSKNYEYIEGGYEDQSLGTVTDIRNQKVEFAPLKDGNLEFQLSRLDKRAQDKFRTFISELQKRGWIIIMDPLGGRRTKYEQLMVQKQSDGSINATPEKSKHVHGFAIDINAIASKDIGKIKKGFQLRKGKGVQEQLRYNKIWFDSGIPQLAKEYGIFWGGNYNTYKDNVHFELRTNDLKQETKKEEEKFQLVTKQVEDGFKDVIDVESAFSNFKVNEEVFNFFLRKQQMDIIDIVQDINLIDSKDLLNNQMNDLSIFERNNFNNDSITNKFKNNNNV